ncbi:hypothetical protein LINGRAHAP2_LOCUS4657, partial [Linum grandiflorum]
MAPKNKKKILSWNVQGLGSAWTSKSLTALWRQTLPSIIFLSETKNLQARVRRKLVKRLAINNFVFVDPVGQSGGLVMAWS